MAAQARDGGLGGGDRVVDVGSVAEWTLHSTRSASLGLCTSNGSPSVRASPSTTVGMVSPNQDLAVFTPSS